MSDVPTRLLREALGGGMTPAPSSGCIDSETLAAWSDGTLSARDLAAVESHASSCLQCQALLAAMTRLDWLETSASPTRRWWGASAIGWLVPVAVAAAAVLVWINVPGGRLARSATPPRASAAVRAPSAPSADRPAESKIAERAAVPSAPPAAAPQRPTRPDEQRARAGRDAASSSARRSEQANTVPGGAPDAAVALPPARPAPPVAEPSPQITATEAQPTASAEVPQAAAPKALSRARTMADQAMLGARAQVMAKTLAVPTVIVSPDANVRWRLVTSGVERSIDGGVTWEAQATGVAATLTAGAAPSATICWLVGPGGVIVLSTDGKTWRRVSFPETIDLTSIFASDAGKATVAAIDGRTFATSDGGKTWRPL